MVGMILVLLIKRIQMEFKPLETEDQLAKIKDNKGYTIIFKHNTTCPISKGVRRDFEQEMKNLREDTSLYMLDLLAHRNVSDAIAEVFNVPHQSPQLLLIKDGECTYNEALYSITVEDTAKAMKEN